MNEIVQVAAPIILQKGLSSGEYIRMGMIIKEASTGKIVGHLKEVGQLTSTLSNIPLGANPLGILSDAYQGVQLEQIKQSLETLQLISSVGAVASVATLGVSVAGFAVITKKIKQLDNKLDKVLEKIEVVKRLLQELHEDTNLLKFSEVETAYLQLDKALVADDNTRRRELLVNSNNIFTKYKQYYLKVAQHKNLWEDSLMPLDIANNLFSRYITCALGELYSEILLGDLSTANKTWEQITQDLKTINHFDKVSVLRAHSDNAIECNINLNFNILQQDIKFTDKLIRETTERIETMSYEIKYLEQTKIEPIDYMKQLRDMDDAIIMIKAV